MTAKSLEKTETAVTVSDEILVFGANLARAFERVNPVEQYNDLVDQQLVANVGIIATQQPDGSTTFDYANPEANRAFGIRLGQLFNVASLKP